MDLNNKKRNKNKNKKWYHHLLKVVTWISYILSILFIIFLTIAMCQSCNSQIDKSLDKKQTKRVLRANDTSTLLSNINNFNDLPYKLINGGEKRFLTYIDTNIGENNSSNSDANNVGIGYYFYYLPNQTSDYIGFNYRFGLSDDYYSFNVTLCRLSYGENADDNYNPISVAGFYDNNNELYIDFTDLKYNLNSIQASDYYYLAQFNLSHNFDSLYSYDNFIENFIPRNNNYYYQNVDSITYQNSFIVNNLTLTNYQFYEISDFNNLTFNNYGDVKALLDACNITYVSGVTPIPADNELLDVFGLMLSAFEVVVPLLGIEIFKGLTLASLILIPMVVGVIILILHAIRR